MGYWTKIEFDPYRRSNWAWLKFISLKLLSDGHEEHTVANPQGGLQAFNLNWEHAAWLSKDREEWRKFADTLHTTNSIYRPPSIGRMTRMMKIYYS